MSNSISIVSTSSKPMKEMSDQELEIAIQDLSEVVEFLTRESASMEEKCYAESVKQTMNLYSKDLSCRRTSK